ncbi:MAG: hypothetical protein J5802_07110 [Butyrivibrio sp.]|nr:hypothetical protein [Butyrivibrio sp.]
MRKMTTIPVLLATMMMLTVSGCGSVSANDTSEAVNFEENIEDVSNDVSTSEGDGSETDADETSADDNSADATITDDSFELEGKKISVLDDTDTILANMTCDETKKFDDGCSQYQRYNDEGMVELETQVLDGKEEVLTIFTSRKDVKTSKGIGLGNTEAELIAAYGEPKSKSNDNFNDYVYEFDGYTITFSFGLEESIQHMLYTNTANYARFMAM